MCLSSDALLQHLPSYLGFSYLERGVSLHGGSSKVQLLLFTLDEGYLLTTALPDLHRGIAPLGPSASMQPPLLGHGVAPPSRHWPQTPGRLLLAATLTADAGWLLLAIPVPSQPGTLVLKEGIRGQTH